MEKLARVRCSDLEGFIQQMLADHCLGKKGQPLILYGREQEALSSGTHTLWMEADLSHSDACSPGK